MKKILFNRIVCLLFIALLGGCAQTYSNLPYSETVMSMPVKEYLQKAAQSQGKEQQNYQIQAASQLVADNNLNAAEQLLNTLGKVQLDPLAAKQKFILEARLELQRNKPKTALKKLHLVNDPMYLPKEMAVTYYTISAEAYLRGNNLAYSTIARISLNSFVEDQNVKQQNQVIIWHNLQTLSLAKLNKLLSRSNSTLLRGWIELAITARQNANHLTQLVSAIQRWQQKYPNHTANGVLPTAAAMTYVDQARIPAQIALLLPLHGKFAKMGQAVRDGFMTAFYVNAKSLPQTPNIKIYDTEGGDVEALYSQAIQQGAQFVIGPLTKTNVEVLAKSGNITVPTLALNYLPSDQKVSQNMIQFGLSPEQEARQAANAMWQHGINNLLIIVPQSDWGRRVNQAFMSQWQKLGGYITGSIGFVSKKDFSAEINSALNINQSKQRILGLQQLLDQKLKAVVRRRQDINGIFLAATPAQARQIYPLLKFYYAGNIPIFSISNIYAGYPSPRNDSDLNGIYFNDMPWVLNESKYIRGLKQQIQSSWLTNYRANSRLYALGVDAYTLSLLLPRVINLPNFAINGVVGQLYLRANQQLYCQLLWARFSHGTPSLVRK
jgi:uncharacterized protein